MHNIIEKDLYIFVDSRERVMQCPLPVIDVYI